MLTPNTAIDVFHLSPPAKRRSANVSGASMIESRQLKTDPSRFDREQKDYRRLYLASFAIFLVVALVSRLLPSRWRPAAGGQVRRGGARRSILTEARETAHATLGFAFMH